MPYLTDGSSGAEDQLPMMMTSINITSPSSGSYNNSRSVKVSWTATDAISGIKSILMSIDGSTWINVTGETSYTFNGLADGKYIAYVKNDRQYWQCEHDVSDVHSGHDSSDDNVGLTVERLVLSEARAAC